MLVRVNALIMDHQYRRLLGRCELVAVPKGQKQIYLAYSRVKL